MIEINQLKIDCYKRKIFGVNPMVSTEKILREGTQKKIKKDQVVLLEEMSKTEKNNLRKEYQRNFRTDQKVNRMAAGPSL